MKRITMIGPYDLLEEITQRLRRPTSGVRVLADRDRWLKPPEPADNWGPDTPRLRVLVVRVER